MKREELNKIIEKISYVKVQFEDEDILDEYCCALRNEIKDAFSDEVGEQE